MDSAHASVIDCGTAARARSGEVECGDASLVMLIATGALIAVVDGLGHGAEAARAARTALSVVEVQPSESPAVLLRRSHEALRGTRGAVMSIALVNAERGVLTWAGVGNVAGVLVRVGEASTRCTSLVLRRGVLGSSIPRIAESTVPLVTGDTLVLTTDGVRWNPDETPPGEPPASMAQRLLDQYANPSDDALVVVARYVGPRR